MGKIIQLKDKDDLVYPKVLKEFNKNVNGYAILGDGLIFQWGTYSTGAFSESEKQITIPFNTNFPNMCWQVQLSLNDVGNGVTMLNNSVGSLSRTTTNFVANFKRLNNYPTTSVTLYWFAIGY